MNLIWENNAIDKATLSAADTREHLDALRKIFEDFKIKPSASRGGDCNHCLIWNTDNPQNPHYRVLRVLVEADGVGGLTPLQVGRLAALNRRQTKAVLARLFEGNVIRIRRSPRREDGPLWYATGCSCSLPF